MPAGRPLEPAGNGGPRWMAAEWDRRKAPGNRIRLTGQLVRTKPVSCGTVVVIVFGARQGHKNSRSPGDRPPVDGRTLVAGRHIRTCGSERGTVNGTWSAHGQCGRGVAESPLHGLDRLAVADEQRGVVVAKVVEAGAAGCACGGDRGPPDLSGERGAADPAAVVVGENEAVVVPLHVAHGVGGLSVSALHRRPEPRTRLGRRSGRSGRCRPRIDHGPNHRTQPRACRAASCCCLGLVARVVVSSARPRGTATATAAGEARLRCSA